MSILNWDKSLEIGHEKIDEQHKKLVEIINRLHTAQLNGTGPQEIKLTLMELYKYTLYHFSEEESLMGGIEPSIRRAHKLEHEDFVSKLDVLAERVKVGDVSIGTETFTWLVGWHLDHISKPDRELVAALGRQKVSKEC